MRQKILDTITYFDYFSFPLKVEEIHHWLEVEIERKSLDKELAELASIGKIQTFENYFGLSNIEVKAEERRKGEQRCTDEWGQILRSARIIAHFPFVRMVGISGTASKGILKGESDYDFFILTAQNRLWICRTILHLFKKTTFLVGAQHAFCMNYFKDESRLKIEEQSNFTAIELLTLIPVTGEDLYHKLLQANEWMWTRFPNALKAKNAQSVKLGKGWQGVFETMCRPMATNKMNERLMNLTYSKWRSKWKKRGYDMDRFDRSFKTNLYESKNHPDNMAEQLESVLEAK